MIAIEGLTISCRKQDSGTIRCVSGCLWRPSEQTNDLAGQKNRKDVRVVVLLDDNELISTSVGHESLEKEAVLMNV